MVSADVFIRNYPSGQWFGNLRSAEEDLQSPCHFSVSPPPRLSHIATKTAFVIQHKIKNKNQRNGFTHITIEYIPFSSAQSYLLRSSPSAKSCCSKNCSIKKKP